MRKLLVNLACVTLGLILGSAASVSYHNTRPAPAPAPAPVLLDLATLYDCAHEDGASDEYPCKWDARVRGNGQYGGMHPVLIYADPSECRLWILPAEARCVTTE